MDIKELEVKSREVRRLSLAAIYAAQSGHPGGCLSCADLITYIYDQLVDLKNPDRENRFILSKGHAAPAQYAIASVEKMISKNELLSLRKYKSNMQGHPSVLCLDWTETSTGSLGQGFSFAIGMALGKKHKKENGNIYALVGDGELQEGSIWEGAMFAAHYKLDNLCIIVDYNKMQSDDLNENIMGLIPLDKKWESFNWFVNEIDGHNFKEIAKAFLLANNTKGVPKIIIANTIKGKGVNFMENVPSWHGSVAMKQSELNNALLDLGVNKKLIDQYYKK